MIIILGTQGKRSRLIEQCVGSEEKGVVKEGQRGTWVFGIPSVHFIGKVLGMMVLSMDSWAKAMSVGTLWGELK